MFLPYKYTEEETFEKGFTEYYQNHIVPLAKVHEKNRGKRKLFHSINIISALSSGAGTSYLIIKSVWFAKFAHGNKKSGGILLLPFYFFWWLMVHRPRRKYFQALKNDFVPKILEFYGDFTYTASGVINGYLLDQHTGYEAASFNIFSCEDVIKFHREGLFCTILERTFWDIKKPTGKVFVLIRSKENFGIDAVIISKVRDKGAKFTDKRLIKKRKLNPKSCYVGKNFNEIFSLHTNDTNINKWISEDFFKVLAQMYDVFEKEGFVFSVKGSHILIELESKGNLFEIGHNHDVPVANASDIKNFLRELTTVLSLFENISKIVNKKDKPAV